jgi:hypothetical protein
MRQKAEQLLQLRSFTSSGKKHQHHEAPNDPDLTLPDHSNGSRNAKKHQQQQQRRDSVASSSGFVSFGSGQLSTLVRRKKYAVILYFPNLIYCRMSKLRLNIC